MTEPGPDADATALVLRPLGWREADGAARLWRDLLVLAVPLTPGVLWLALASEQHPWVAVVVLAGVLAVLGAYATELLMVRHERVVVTASTVEWWRGKRLRARLQRGPTLRAARYVPWPVGRPLGLIHLAVSDGTTGFRLGDARWIARFEAIVLAAQLAAPRLTPARARRRMPECFTAVERLPDALRARGSAWVAVGVVVLLAAGLAGYLVGALTGAGP
jgi:hypothetical protein